MESSLNKKQAPIFQKLNTEPNYEPNEEMILGKSSKAKIKTIKHLNSLLNTQENFAKRVHTQPTNDSDKDHFRTAEFKTEKHVKLLSFEKYSTYDSIARDSGKELKCKSTIKKELKINTPKETYLKKLSQNLDSNSLHPSNYNTLDMFFKLYKPPKKK